MLRYSAVWRTWLQASLPSSCGEFIERESMQGCLIAEGIDYKIRIKKPVFLMEES